MLRDLYDQMTAEDSSGRYSIWRDVYKKMRCLDLLVTTKGSAVGWI